MAIAQWAATAPQALGVCGASPSAATFRRVLAAVDITAVEAALTTWVTGRQARARAQQPAATTAAACRTVLAVDGKTLRGSKAAGRQTKLVCVYDHASGLVLTQTTVADGDEIAAFTTALGCLPKLAGVLVTADALHCQRRHAEFLTARGGHYLFTVQANQPTLRQVLRRLPWAAARGRGAAAEDTAAPSPARSRSSTWREQASTSCSPAPAARSRWFADASSAASDRWRSSTP